MFDWTDLTFFLELARHGRLMPAARRLKVDNTTVSRRIAELERGARHEALPALLRRVPADRGWP